MGQTNLRNPENKSLLSGLIVGIVKILSICFLSSWTFQAVGFAAD